MQPIDITEQVRITMDALRESWAWLGELLEPGRETRTTPVLTDAQRARAAEAGKAERAERAQNAADGLSALASTSAPIRLGVVDAQLAVRELVLGAARLAAAELGAVYVGGRAGDAAVLDALDWFDGGPSCWVASTTGVIGRQLRAGAIDMLPRSSLHAYERTFARADRMARTVAQSQGERTVRFPQPCPACGGRSLQWRMPGEDERRWSVVCIRQACRCSGVGCGCRRAVRYAGRPHAWGYGELSGPYGLWRAVAAARRARPRIRANTRGHGGWAERRTGR